MLKKQILSNLQYFQTKINATEMPPDVSCFGEVNLLPRVTRIEFKSQKKVQEIT